MNYWRHLTLVLSLTALPVCAADQLTDLLKQANTALQQGQYYLALTDLNTALPLAETDTQHIQTLGLLGLTHYRMHHYPQAEALLQEAINTGQGEAQDRARWHIALAALKTNQDQPDQAKRLYTAALKLAGNNPELQISIQLGQVQLLPNNLRFAALQKIAPQISIVTPPEARIPHLLNIAAFVRKLDKNTDQQHHKTHLKLAYASLEQAKALSNAQHPRHWAEILDGLAQLYEEENRLDEALYLNGQALQAAKSVQADDLLLDLEWRQGRLCRAKQQLPAAMAAYQRAVDHIEAIRQDIPVEYHDGSSSFRETLEPVYLGLADLLLLGACRT
ncbi:MAG: tetratricopeptide repeat protein [Methylococcaceae bacterium]|nr:tetratricopeptide repeat protein [Methylococcaceae bacterium]